MGLFTTDNKHRSTVAKAVSHNARAKATKALPNECDHCGKRIRKGNYCSPSCAKAAVTSWQG